MSKRLMQILVAIGLAVLLPGKAALALPAPQTASGDAGSHVIAAVQGDTPPLESADRELAEPSRPWSFSVVGGRGGREVDGHAIGVPYVGFWAAQKRRPNLDLVYELFTLTRTTRSRGPDPLWVNPDLNMAGTAPIRSRTSPTAD
jgi:hypothetical protein